MLKKLILENWKSFRYAELPIDPLTILIGTNASGKSNAIEALDLLGRVGQGGSIQLALSGGVDVPPIRGNAEWLTFKSESIFKLKAILQGNEPSSEYLYEIVLEPATKIQLFSESLVEIKNPRTSRESREVIYFYNRNGSRETGKSSLFLDIRGMIRELLNVFVLNPIPSKMRAYSALSTNLLSDGSNIAGVLAALSDEHKAQVETTLSRYIIDLPDNDIKRVWSETVGRLQSDAMLYCEEIWGKNQSPMVMDARGMSDGTLRFLAILTALLTCSTGSQLVIEEVDNGLHSSRSSLLLKMLKEIGAERQIDILVTTHNPALLDALEPEMIPFVVVAHRDSESGESKLTPLDDLENLPKLLASGSLGKLAERGSIERNLSGAK